MGLVFPVFSEFNLLFWEVTSLVYHLIFKLQGGSAFFSFGNLSAAAKKAGRDLRPGPSECVRYFWKLTPATVTLT